MTRQRYRRMRRVSLIAAVLMATVLVAPAAADAKPSPRQQALVKMNGYLAKKAWAKRAKLGKCKRRGERVICHGAVRGPRRSCRVKLIVKQRGVKLRVVKCQRRSPGSGARALLSASLGEPGRQPLDPFLVTYPQEAQDTTSADPRGVLTLYVDGLLECAENVSGERAASTCPVDYDRLGSYRVTTIYTSGSESAADSMVHEVGPLPTSTSLSATFNEFPSPQEATGPGVQGGWFWLGDLTLQWSADPITVSAFVGCADPPIETYGRLTASGCYQPNGQLVGDRGDSLHVYANGGCEQIGGPPIDDGPLEFQGTLDHLRIMERPPHTTDPNVTWPTVGEVAAGTYHLRASVEAGPMTNAGYLPSEARVPLQFSPQWRPDFCG